MPFIRTLSAVTPLVALAACASVPESDAQADAEAEATAPVIVSDRSCFFTRSIRGFSEAPDGPGRAERIYVDTGQGERHVLEAHGSCPDLDFSVRIGIEARPASGVNLCTGDTATLLLPRTGGVGPDRCLARVIGRVVDTE